MNFLEPEPPPSALGMFVLLACSMIMAGIIGYLIFTLLIRWIS